MKDQTISSSLEKSEEHFRIIQKIAHLGSWRINIGSSRVTPTAEACRIYGIEYKKYPLAYLKNLVLPEYRPILDDALKNLKEKGLTYDVEYQIKRVSDGDVRDIHSIAEYDSEKQIVTGVIHDITARKTVEHALQESEQRYRSLFDNSVSGIIYTDIEGNILEVNATMLQILGSPSAEATKKINILTFPLLVESGFSEDFRKVIETSSIVHGAAQYKSKWGSELYLEYVLNPVKQGNKVTKVIGKIEDITYRKHFEEKVDALLEQKEILLREIYHRLKNNMASIEGLLMIQLGDADDERVNAPLQDAVGRLRSMRVLYDKLYLSADFIHTSIEDYLSTLIDEIFEVFPGSRDVEVLKNIQNFLIPSDKIFPLGLIVNELLTNAFKYAFMENGKRGLLEITAAFTEGNVRIIVKDNGPGYPSLDANGRPAGFGLQLIRMLTKQIDGTVDFCNDNGAICTIDFNI
ncbi:MAG: PAS domain S-box protein [Spirochaetales bacterium]|nr:PAS domain S-box protein [Spirochaetales bacterium]